MIGLPPPPPRAPQPPRPSCTFSPETALENGYTKIMLPTCASGIACPMLSATIKAKLYQPMSCMSMHDGRYLWFFNFMVVWPSRHPPAQTRYSSTTAAGGGDVAKGWQILDGS
ncbi:hypothetical protein ZEAMMB73_Zm00001d034157 [Zea mays]|uniref:Uncharacterized protein n=1 Tax=Zea mays TaxID=4577 RepID=A0A1D6L5T5_MAIZE|nr:hypothetical protein ZEAMMB73_Zm00001d034157 [Zea mays]